MDIAERAKKAVDLKQHYGYNCCQAVTAALADLTNLSEEQLNHLASGFCAGMGNMQATGGSLIGAGMIAGLQKEGNGTLRFTRQISEKFQEKSGALACKDLKGIETGRMVCSCEDCVKNAVLAYGEVMGEV